MNTPPHTPCQGVARPPEAERVARCANCAHYTPTFTTRGTCRRIRLLCWHQSAPIFLPCLPHAPACPLFKRKPQKSQS